MDILLNVVTEFGRLLVEVLPYFLVGVITGALVQAYASERITRPLFAGTGVGAIARAVAAGALLPGCSCTTVPLARGLLGTPGVGLGTVAAFILVSPLLSPTTVLLTFGVLGWEFTLARVAASLLGAMALGLIVLRFEPWFAAGRRERGEEPEPGAPTCTDACCEDDGCDTASPPTFGSHFTDILRETIPHLALGLAIAAALTTLLPADAIPRLLGSGSGFLAYALAALAGIPFYTCEGEEVPLTLGLLAVGLGSGPALTFLLGSVGTCIPTMLMARPLLGMRATATYLVFWFAFAIAAGLAFAAALP